jgi:hypothetical protein
VIAIEGRERLTGVTIAEVDPAPESRSRNRRKNRL